MITNVMQYILRLQRQTRHRLPHPKPLLGRLLRLLRACISLVRQSGHLEVLYQIGQSSAVVVWLWWCRRCMQGGRCGFGGFDRLRSLVFDDLDLLLDLLLLLLLLDYLFPCVLVARIIVLVVLLPTSISTCPPYRAAQLTHS